MLLLANSHRRRPASHTIVEAHPDVLARMEIDGWPERYAILTMALLSALTIALLSRLTMARYFLWLFTFMALYLLWPYSLRPGVAVLAGTWQQVLPPLCDPASPPFDAIFFDTFAEGMMHVLVVGCCSWMLCSRRDLPVALIMAMLTIAMLTVAMLTIAMLTIAMLTMAVLTMAVLTMAVLTMAMLTMDGYVY